METQPRAAKYRPGCRRQGLAGVGCFPRCSGDYRPLDARRAGIVGAQGDFRLRTVAACQPEQESCIASRVRLVFWFWLAVVIFFTTLPWRFVGHAHWNAIDWMPFLGPSSGAGAWYRDAPLNFLLFVPLGLLAYRPKTGHGFRSAVLIGLCASVAAEFFQVFSHGRFPSVNDVIVNVAGAAVGAALGRRWFGEPPEGGIRSADIPAPSR